MSLFQILRLHLVSTCSIGIHVHAAFDEAWDTCYGEGEDKVNHGDDCKCLEVLIGLRCYGISEK